MRKRTRMSILTAIALGATVGITACGTHASSPANSTSSSSNTANSSTGGSSQTTSSSSTTSSNGTLTVALNGNPTTLDPWDTEDNLSYTIEKTMYQGLLGFNPQMKMIPVLAKSYQVSSDAMQITFELRQGIKFADGTPFNAQAVKVNIERGDNPANHLKRYSLFSMIKDVKVLGPYKVQVDLKTPFGAIANNFAHPAAMMISPAAIQKWGAKVSQHPDGTGPYEFVNWQDGRDLVVKQNPNYWGTKTNVKEINFDFVKDGATRVDMLKTGEAQFIYPVPTDQFSLLKANPKIVLAHKPSILVNYIAMNTQVKPFNNVKVRQAMNYAINKQAYIKVAQNGYATPLLSAIAPNTWGYAAQTPYTYNVQKAKQLLAAAGYPKGFSVTLMSNNSTQSVKWDQFIQQQLSLVGVNVKVDSMDGSTLFSKIFVPPSKSPLQMYIGEWSPSTGDADWGIRPLLAKADWPPNGYNIGFYSDPIVNQAIAAGLQTADPSKRMAAYATAQAQIYKDAPWVFLSVPENVFAYRSNVQGATAMPDATLDLSDVSFTN